MPQEAFQEKFPELAETETLGVIISRQADIPDGDYGFVEMYCNEHNCDCRKVSINVMDREGKTYAFINYGWESVDYYHKWGVDKKIAKKMASICFEMSFPRSKTANKFLNLFEDIVQSDPAYVKRIQTHYKLFKQKIDSKVTVKNSEKKMGRNEPCPCGSGKKYKKCCLNIAVA